MTDKERLLKFIDELVPEACVFGKITLTFDDDGSAIIRIAPREGGEDA